MNYQVRIVRKAQDYFVQIYDAELNLADYDDDADFYANAIDASACLTFWGCKLWAKRTVKRLRKEATWILTEDEL